ncbi:TIGR01777 family oxidoreductase [Salmonirosea aquatica]|uniref:TIGR01777 family protein n=1 Tax=Salmonirosea aquatica TaxID=2654236 RepID=A0A7C9FEK2_9BACT|nr:TIGR01777 family protein [Cytophagaceae bacterium SJW1-29]
MEKVVIFGGTGFIGQSLANHCIKKGIHPIVVARHKPKGPIQYDFRSWDSISIGEWVSELSNSKALVNLTGKTVDCIKTPDNCDLILRSRVDSTRIIGKALTLVDNPPKIWIQMSTAHIYGDPPEQVCTESSSTGYGLAPFVGKAWEKAFKESIPGDTRGVILRTSFVIGKNGGALASLQKIVRLGLGGTVGHGRQGMSWIHEDDMNEIIYQAIMNESYKGIYISSAPSPVSNEEFMRLMRKKMHIPIGVPAPEFITRIGAKFIFNTDPELVLYGRYVKSERIEQEGFKFRYPTLEQALDDLIVR